MIELTKISYIFLKRFFMKIYIYFIIFIIYKRILENLKFIKFYKSIFFLDLNIKFIANKENKFKIIIIIIKLFNLFEFYLNIKF